MNRLRLILGTVLVLALFAAGCGDDGADTGEFGLVNEGTLTVCTDSPYPPMEF